MSFSKSKVERFPTLANTGVQIRLHGRKRPYMHSSLSDSMSSFSSQNTPSTEGQLTSAFNSQKQKCSGQNASKSAGSQKKFPNERISTRGCRSRVVMSKPTCSPITSRGSSSLAKKNSRERSNASSRAPSLARRQLVTSKKSVSSKISKSATNDDLQTPKQTKLNDTLNKNYSTPLTSPRPSPNKTIDWPTVIEIDSRGTVMEQTRAEQPLTPFPAEIACLSDTSLELSWRETSVFSIKYAPGDGTENQRSLLRKGNNELENSTVTTSGRMPMRRSLYRQCGGNTSTPFGSPSSAHPFRRISFEDEQNGRRSIPSIPSASVDRGQWDASSDMWNNAFMQFHVQDTVAQDNMSLFSPTTTTSATWTNAGNPSSQTLHLLSPFDSNMHFPVASTPETKNPPPTSINWLDRIGTIGSMVLSIFQWRKSKSGKTVENRGSTSSGLNIMLNNICNSDSRGHYFMPRRVNETHLCTNSSIPVTSRSFWHGRTLPYRPSREVRRLLRVIRLEARRTMQDIKVMILIPGKRHLLSEHFWMPVLEFIAGQVIEIIQTSFQR